MVQFSLRIRHILGAAIERPLWGQGPVTKERGRRPSGFQGSPPGHALGPRPRDEGTGPQAIGVPGVAPWARTGAKAP
jgi:hypothetical protein